MSERVFSCITLRALMRLYQIELKPNADGSSSGRLPWSVCPGATLTLAAGGGTWSINELNPLEGGLPVRGTQIGDRLDFIMRMECVTRTRAAELLHVSFPAILEREGIPEDGGFADESDASRSDGERPGTPRVQDFHATACHAATQIGIEEAMWDMLDRKGC